MVAGLSWVNAFSLIASVVVLAEAERVEFLSKPSIITVEKGKTAIFPCKVDNLEKSHRVAWVSSSSTKLLSIDGHTLSSNNHVIVTIDPIGGFQLHINKVTSRDAGEYKCMVTTDPVIEQTSVLHVSDDQNTKRKRRPAVQRSSTKVGQKVSQRKRKDLLYPKNMEKNGHI